MEHELTRVEQTAVEIMHANCAYDTFAKAAFKRTAMRYLRKLARELDLAPKQYEVRYNPGGIAVGGDAILHSDNIYISVSPGRDMMFRNKPVLVRAVDDRHDYEGGTNCFMSYEALVQTQQAVSFVRRLLAREANHPTTRKGRRLSLAG
ncbi:MAG: hypothetical protein L0H29_00345 [Sinobacteraceae bacterium]|nr:hypothetical protein [Nevskiaceae bacterium]